MVLLWIGVAKGDMRVRIEVPHYDDLIAITPLKEDGTVDEMSTDTYINRVGVWRRPLRVQVKMLRSKNGQPWFKKCGQRKKKGFYCVETQRTHGTREAAAKGKKKQC